MTRREARREKSWGRIALFGVSKSGKTLTALMIAKALGGDKITVIDSEHGSSEKYADRIPFHIDVLADHHPDTYRQAIIEAHQAGDQVVVIDSGSHAWMGNKGILEIVDSETPSGGSSFTSGWSKVRPIESAFWNTLLGVPMHVIMTLRSKQQYVEEQVEKGGRTKTQFRKVGMGPIQRDGLEYEFDITGELDLEHNLTITGSRYEELQEGDVVPRPDVEFGLMLAGVFDKGLERQAPPDAKPEDLEVLTGLLMEEGAVDEKRIRDIIESKRVENKGSVDPAWVAEETAKVQRRLASRKPEEKKPDEAKPEQAPEAPAPEAGESKGGAADAATSEAKDGTSA